jgi:RNA recognition motif-containing protein
VKPKTSVFVANLPLSVRMDDLAELFKDYQVESALVAIKRKYVFFLFRKREKKMAHLFFI